ncbi:MAG TPA: right-handed parallel beta-helix repeat-containing protein [Candidatus Binataceae bacterium]|nr:right-handed parallel beta-helix repeat-containing protein [Candidatus Binataceae bacterium]
MFSYSGCVYAKGCRKGFMKKGAATVAALLGIVYGVAVVGTSNAGSNALIINGQRNKVYANLRISSTRGNCVSIVNSFNITIEASDVGPCGGHAVYISGGSGNKVFDSYLHSEHPGNKCCDSHEGVRITAGSSFATIQGNVIAYNETNVRVDRGAHDIMVKGNYLVNPLGPYPRGQNFQSDTAERLAVVGNYAYSCTLNGTGKPCPALPRFLYSEVQEDSINFFKTDSFTAANNYVVGGHSGSGCGLIADFAANDGDFRSNVVVDTGQCGIGIADGVNQVVSGNRILNLTPIHGAGNTALYVWKQYSPACGPVRVFNNITDELKADGSHSGYWDGGGCKPISLSGNVFGNAAYNALYPIASTVLPPLVPPIPKHCVATSPYSTQTSAPPCRLSGESTPANTRQSLNRGIASAAEQAHKP